jgi:cytidylate kinase
MARNVQQILEEQVSRWRVERQGSAERPSRVPAAQPNVLTLSNAYGSTGIAIAIRAGQLLGFPVYDREIVEHIATTTNVRVETVQTLDERAQSRLDDYMTSLLHERNFDQDDYVKALTRTVVALCEHGACVIIGRGAAHILRRKQTLAVRTIAPGSQRVRRIQDMEGLDREAARRRMERVDAEREAFIRRFFGADIHDPMTYDLVINTGEIDADAGAAIVVEAYRRKFGAA